MENKINKILVLGDNSKYLVLNQAIYKGTSYYFVVRVTKDEQDITDEFRLLEEKIVDDSTVVSTVKDPAIIKLLAEYLQPKL